MNDFDLNCPHCLGDMQQISGYQSQDGTEYLHVICKVCESEYTVKIKWTQLKYCNESHCTK